MDIEQRVEELEQEVQLLKGQIQATLLEIQDALLTNKYGALRGEMGGIKEDDTQPVPAVHVEGQASHSTAAQPQPAPIDHNAPTIHSRKQLQTTQSPPLEPFEEDPISVRKVSLNQLVSSSPVHPVKAPQPSQTVVKQKPKSAAHYQQNAQPKQQHHQPQQSTGMTMNDLQQWTLDKMRDVGVQQTRQIIDAYAHDGYLTQQEQHALHSYIDQKLKQARQIRKKAGANPNRSAQVEMTTVQAPEADSDSHDDDGRSVILRLIGGINNAAAGINWRQKRG